METKPIPNDLENEVYLEKIARSARNLDTLSDTLLFVQQMMQLGKLLSSLDSHPANSIPAIDENTNDPTYFVAAYLDTENIAEALSVYRIVKLLTRYVLLSDKFYETRNEKFALLAKQVHRMVKELLRSQSNTQHLIYSIDYWLGQFSEFWQFEQITKRLILERHTFSFAEIRQFNLSKSSDASLIYAKVLDARLPSFNENVALVLHYNQALLDIYDDWEDIEDDVGEDMPNIFVMAALENISYNRIRKSGHDKIRQVVMSSIKSSGGPVSRLVNELHSSIKCVSIHKNYAFLKFLSDRYADTLRKKITSEIS